MMKQAIVEQSEPTKDELRVLAAVAGGAEMTAEEISEQLGISMNAVSTHLCRIFQQVSDVDTKRVAQELGAQWLREEGGA